MDAVRAHGEIQEAITARSIGGVLVLPRVTFAVKRDAERAVHRRRLVRRPPKNVSLDGRRPVGARHRRGTCAPAAMVRALRGRRGDAGRHAVPALRAYVKRVPHELARSLPPATTSRGAKGRRALHVDAISLAPQSRAKRILRVFNELNPREPRVWRVGEVRDDGESHCCVHPPAPPVPRAAVLAALHVSGASAVPTTT